MLKIKVVNLSKNETPIVINKQGDWFDIKSADKVDIKRDINQQQSIMISLGVVMELPKGFEAHVLPRSSTYKNFGITLTNSMGIIDESYCGYDKEHPEKSDIWRFNAEIKKDCNIEIGDRIAQFRIVPKMCSSFWTKLKWLFNKKVEIVYVDELNNKIRGGFGATGKK